jgi:hypothetical protein
MFTLLKMLPRTYLIYAGIGNTEAFSSGCGSPVFFSMLQVAASHVGKWGEGGCGGSEHENEIVYGAEYSTLCRTSLYNSNSLPENAINPK